MPAQPENLQQTPTDNFPKRKPIRKLQVDFSIPYLFKFITILGRKQEAVIRNHNNANICYTEQGESIRRKYKRFKFCCGQAYDF